ncbi:hypothetical protein GCK32_021272 [Trichostrongylus colubriformis]|uniref:Uncharacterized protein n=1 Tax=Trichostrongylus colubriformis TaxID=6319 RepID=A0AAN8ID37_TRICO
MEEAAPIDATVKAAKRQQAIKAKTIASKTVRPAKSKPATKTTKRLQELEQIIKSYHEQNMKMHKSNEAKLDEVDTKVNLLTARFSQTEDHFKDCRRSSDSDELKRMDYGWDELRSEFKLLREEVSAMNLAQLSDDIKGLCERFGDFSLHLPRIDISRNVTPVEPSPELDRIRRQIDETEKELQRVRKKAVEVNLLIEKTWQKDRHSDAIDDLNVKRRRLQWKETRLKEEMRDLERRLKREKNGKHRRRDIQLERTLRATARSLGTTPSLAVNDCAAGSIEAPLFTD